MAGDHGHGHAHTHTGPKNMAYYFNSTTTFGRRNVSLTIARQHRDNTYHTPQVVFGSFALYFVLYKALSGGEKAPAAVAAPAKH